MAIEYPTIVVNIHRAAEAVALAKRQGRFVLIDRTTIWGNPYSDRLGTAAQWIVESREEACRRYAEWVLSKPDLVEQLPSLRGKVLGCHCLPLVCHGVVLARLVHGGRYLDDFAPLVDRPLPKPRA